MMMLEGPLPRAPPKRREQGEPAIALSSLVESKLGEQKVKEITPNMRQGETQARTPPHKVVRAIER